eukprot:331204_1
MKAIFTLQDKHEKEMEALKNKFDKQIAKIKKKLPAEVKENLCIDCSCECDTKCESCGEAICEECGQSCESDACGNMYCKECSETDGNLEECCGDKYCHGGSCYKYHRKTNCAHQGW